MFDLESIGPLNLYRLEVTEVEHGGVRLRFNQPVQLQPRLNEDNPQFVNVEEPESRTRCIRGHSERLDG